MPRLIAAFLLFAGSACSYSSIDSEFKAKIEACEEIKDEQVRSECIQAVRYTDE